MSRRPSLRVVLLASVVAPLVLAAVVVGLLGWASARRTAIELALRVQREVGLRIEGDLRAWLDVPHALDRANADLLRAGLLPVSTDDGVLAHHFHRQLRTADAVSYLQLGLAGDGAFVGVERNEDGTFNLERSDAERTGKDVFLLDLGGDPTGDRLARVDGYDARTRPWYRAAVDAGQPRWSPIYQFSSRRAARLGITAVEPVAAPDGGLLGVVGADLVLSHLADLLRDEAPPGGVVVVMERDGLLVASSGTDPVFRVDERNDTTRLRAADSPDPLVRAATTGIGALDGLDAPTTRVVGDAYVYAAPLADGRGVDWVIVVASPSSTVTAKVDADARRTATLGALVVALAMGVGALVARRLSAPVGSLSDVALALARGDREAPIPTSDIAEVAALADAFGTMRGQLSTTIDGLWRARDDAESANRAKSAFLANMSHELRTPLNAVVGYTDLLLEGQGETPPDEVRSDLERIRTSALHLLGLINELLDLARIESGRQDLELVAVPVGPLVEELVAALQPTALAGRNTLSADVGPDVAGVVADRTRLRQVLVNLVGNATKFTESGRIRVFARAAPDGVVLGVEDTGIGIPEDRLPTVFEAFTRLEAARGREGAGLGLAIVHRLVVAMGGRIEVRSEPGVGTTFLVTLPAAR